MKKFNNSHFYSDNQLIAAAALIAFVVGFIIYLFNN